MVKTKVDAAEFNALLLQKIPSLKNVDNIIGDLFEPVLTFAEHVDGYYETVKKNLAEEGFTVPKTPSKAKAQAKVRGRGRPRRSSAHSPVKESPATQANSRTTRANTRAAAKRLDFDPNDSAQSTSSGTGRRGRAQSKKTKAVRIEDEEGGDATEPANVTAATDETQPDDETRPVADEREKPPTPQTARRITEEQQQPEPEVVAPKEEAPKKGRKKKTSVLPAPSTRRATRSGLTGAKGRDETMVEDSVILVSPVVVPPPPPPPPARTSHIRKSTRQSAAVDNDDEQQWVDADESSVTIPESPSARTTRASTSKHGVKAGGVRKSTRRSSLSTKQLAAAANEAIKDLTTTQQQRAPEPVVLDAPPAADVSDATKNEDSGVEKPTAARRSSKRTKPRTKKRASQLTSVVETDGEMGSPAKKRAAAPTAAAIPVQAPAEPPRAPALLVVKKQDDATYRSPGDSNDDIPASPAPTNNRNFVRAVFSTVKASSKKPTNVSATPTRAAAAALAPTGSAVKPAPRPGLAPLPVAVQQFVVRNTPPRKNREADSREVQERAESIVRKQEQARQNKQNLLKKRMDSTKQKREERQQRVNAVKEEQERLRLEEKQRMEVRMKQAQVAAEERRSPIKPLRSPSKPMPVHSPMRPVVAQQLPLASARPNTDNKQTGQAKITKEERRLLILAATKQKQARQQAKADQLSRELRIINERTTETKKETVEEEVEVSAAVAPKSRHEPAQASGSANVSLNASQLDKGPIAKLKKEAGKLPTVKSSPPKKSRVDSYELTPVRKPKPASDDNYNIDNLNSADETDDEEQPRKKVPAWAEGATLKASLVGQHFNPPDTDYIFRTACTVPDLTELFPKVQRKRFHKRTSSQYWDSPLWKSGNTSRLNASRSESDLTNMM